MPTQRSLAAQGGFTVTEVVVAMAILLTAVLGVLVTLDTAKATTVTTRSREAATNLTREISEAARGIPYAQIADNTIPAALQAVDPGLADTSPGSEYGIVRRDFTYTVTARVCAMDDGRDGGGDHSAGTFCTDSVAPNTPDPRNRVVDRVPEDYKRVSITVGWMLKGAQRSLTQTTIVNNPGSSGAPAIVNLELTAPSGLGAQPEIGPGSEYLSFRATTSSRPTYVRWLLDGADQGRVTTSPTPTTHVFGWDIGEVDDDDTAVEDGVYLVGAEAFDRYGVSGPTRSLSISLNRSEPAAVRGFSGGFAGPQDRERVDLEWLGSPERDVMGYAVWRIGADGSKVLVCPLTTALTCSDAQPPGDQRVTYRVHAYDHELGRPTVPRENAGAETTVVRGNAAPGPPRDLTFAVNPDGTTTLTWNQPTDPDGDPIAFYRVYRAKVGVGQFYARREVTGPNETFIDGATVDGPYQYWVTAVDARYGESPYAGPVGG